MVYAGFKPGGLYRLLGKPMNKFINELLGGNVVTYSKPWICKRIDCQYPNKSGCKINCRGSEYRFLFPENISDIQ
jgi:hypothetical protein